MLTAEEIFQPKGVFAGKVIFPQVAKTSFTRTAFSAVKFVFTPTDKNLPTMDSAHDMILNLYKSWFKSSEKMLKYLRKQETN